MHALDITLVAKEFELGILSKAVGSDIEMSGVSNLAAKLTGYKIDIKPETETME